MSQPPDEPLPTPPGQDDQEGLPLVDLDTLLTRPPSRRKRVVQISLLLAALVVVVVEFGHDALPKPHPGPPVHLQPTPLPRALSILSNVNYGTLTINGQPQPSLLPLVVTLRGQPPYTITLEAPPFRPLSCPFPPPSSLPPENFTPCLTGSEFTLEQQNVTTLQMLFTPADLPLDQQQQITALIPQTVTAQQTITAPAQSFIVTGLPPDGTITTERLSEPLSASVFLVPIRQDSQAGPFCQGFICTDAGGFLPNRSPPSQFWEVTTWVALRWRFTSANGQLVSDVTFPVPTTLTLFLSYVPATGWQVELLSSVQLSQHLTQLVCTTGMQMLAGELAGPLGNQGWDLTVLHDQGVQGCELEAAQQGSDEGQFVWRFGVLLAADAQAHSILPLLPIASSAEVAAVGG